MSETPQSLQIPQTQVPSAASSSPCPENAEGQRSRWLVRSYFADLRASPACATTLRRGISIRVPLCLGYPVHRSLPPTRRSSSDWNLVPGEAQDKPPNPHAILSLLRATRIASEGTHYILCWLLCIGGAKRYCPTPIGKDIQDHESGLPRRAIPRRS